MKEEKIVNDDLGKKAEAKIKEWLNRPEAGYNFYRIPDQLSGNYLTSRNPCDFILYKHPYQYWIESKATYHDRWEFSSLTDFQYESLLKVSEINGVYGIVIVLFATYQRAFVFDIRDIDSYTKTTGKKSLNIMKVDKWSIPYKEIRSVPNNRKRLLDYIGEIEEYLVER